MKERTEEEYLHRMAAYCSSAERCEQEVRKKIKDLPTVAQTRIIQRLRQEGFINDERYCLSFVKDKFRFNRWGKIKISYELRGKGLPTSCIEEALQTIDEEDYRDTLRMILSNKQRSAKDDDPQKVYAKLFRFAASRGFESQLIGKELKNITDVEENSFNME